jgi:hypothetical protein
VIIPKVFMLAAALGTVSALGSAVAWSPNQPGTASPSRAASEHAKPVARCGGKPNADSNAMQQPLPNAYMTVNGRVFSLVDFVACTQRLHTARLS